MDGGGAARDEDVAEKMSEAGMDEGERDNDDDNDGAGKKKETKWIYQQAKIEIIFSTGGGDDGARFGGTATETLVSTAGFLFGFRVAQPTPPTETDTGGEGFLFRFAVDKLMPSGAQDVAFSPLTTPAAAAEDWTELRKTLTTDWKRKHRAAKTKQTKRFKFK